MEHLLLFLSLIRLLFVIFLYVLSDDCTLCQDPKTWVTNILGIITDTLFMDKRAVELSDVITH